MRRLLLSCLLLVPQVALAQGFIHYYPPGGGSGTWDGGDFSASATGPTGVVTPAYSFTADTGAGMGLAAANTLQVQISDQGPTGMGIFTATQGSFGFYDASNNWTGWLNTDAQAELRIDGSSKITIGSGLGTGFLSVNGSTAATARSFTSSDGSVIWSNADGISGNPSAVVDSSVFMRYSSGTGMVSGTGSVGTCYAETDANLFSCYTSTNTPKTFAATAGATFTGVHDFTGAEIAGGSPLVFEGATANASETTLVVTEPTADRTFTLPNADSVAVQPQTCSGTDKVSAVSSLGAVTCSADTSGGAADPITTVTWVDDFTGGNTNTGYIGQLGWQSSASGGSASIGGGIAAHPGLYVLTSGAADNNYYMLYLNAVHTTDYASGEWEMNFIVETPQAVTDTYVSVGLTAGTPLAYTSAIRAFYDTDAAHANWVFQICDSSTTGCQSAGDDTNADTVASTKVPVNGTWQRVRIRRVASGVGGNPTIYMSVGSGAAMETEKTFCASGCDEDLGNIPSADLTPSITVGARAAATSKNFYADLYTHTMTVARY